LKHRIENRIQWRFTSTVNHKLSTINAYFYLRPVDWLFLIYLVSIIILAFFHVHAFFLQLGFIVSFGTLILLIRLACHFFNHRIWSFFAQFYPVFFFIWLYPQACALRYSFFSADFDPWLLSLEKSLFVLEWYRIIPVVFPMWAMEIVHGIYFSYYIALAVFAIISWTKHRRLVSEYIFVLSFTMILHQWMLILFPASGPVYLRSTIMPEGVLFIPAMNWIYTTLDQGGGAFPSLHVAAAFVMTRYSIRFFPKKQWVLILYFILIAFSTIAGSYHYAIDIVAGVITGWISLQIGAYIYSYFAQHEEP